MNGRRWRGGLARQAGEMAGDRGPSYDQFVRALLLVLTFVQTAILAPAQMAPGECQAHTQGAPANEHANGHHRQGAPAPGGDCTHCPPADCARHQACAQAAAVVAESGPMHLHRLAARSIHAVPLSLISADPAPPKQPPRLIA